MPSTMTIRKRSSKTICGLPLFDLAMGPDWEKRELRGHARGIIAIGDIATGWLAIGGIARGIIAIGGGAFGVAAIGGRAVGVLAFGGGAVGGIAIGGGAVGIVAIGGGAAGYYACGAGAVGKFVVSVMERNPEAVEFFKQWFSWLPMVRTILGQGG